MVESYEVRKWKNNRRNCLQHSYIRSNLPSFNSITKYNFTIQELEPIIDNIKQIIEDCNLHHKEEKNKKN